MTPARIESYRTKILAVIDASPVPLTAGEVASLTHIPYKATIDALQALHNRDKVARTGRKFSARWCSKRLVGPPQDALAWSLLAACWFGAMVGGRR